MDLRLPLETIRDAIADALWGAVRAQDLPVACVRLGLSDGTTDDAFRSKRTYVRARLRAHDGPALLGIAAKVLKEYQAPALKDLVSELTTHSQHRVSDLTRREVMKALDPLDPLFGDIPVFDGLESLAPNWRQPSATGVWDDTLKDDIDQHYVRNSDYSNFDLLEMCGALTCSQQRFFDLLEKLLDPTVRRGAEQASLAASLNELLGADGFHAVVVGQQSRHPIYRIQRMTGGVAGSPKNLIFAAIHRKPDLYFTDAINNDIAIRNDTDALVYDQFLSDTGLLWKTLVTWWQARQGIGDLVQAKKELYRRLLRSVVESGSAGEIALFDTYYRHFGPLLGDALPALIPQVYLHYDPKTAAERGRDPVLLRQRMDFLMLLDRNVRTVIEVDGKQHFADGDVASSAKYAEMASQDRELRLNGYELYRFGASEFADVEVRDDKRQIGPIAKTLAVSFFDRFFARHNIGRKT